LKKILTFEMRVSLPSIIIHEDKNETRHNFIIDSLVRWGEGRNLRRQEHLRDKTRLEFDRVNSGGGGGGGGQAISHLAYDSSQGTGDRFVVAGTTNPRREPDIASFYSTTAYSSRDGRGGGGGTRGGGQLITTDLVRPETSSTLNRSFPDTAFLGERGALCPEVHEVAGSEVAGVPALENLASFTRLVSSSNSASFTRLVSSSSIIVKEDAGMLLYMYLVK
jgi:hypothetical protein